MMFFLCNLRNRLAYWLLGFKFHDVSIREGDWITHRGWRYGPVEVVNFNLATRSVAVRLGKDGGIVVWPMDPNSKITHRPRS